MRFGIILPNYLPQATPDGLRRVALLSEELGFDSIWTTDHVMVPRESQVPYKSVLECINVLSWLAGMTQRIKLGVSVVVMPQRHPVLIAKEISTLDTLSNGRVILGLGVGWSKDEFGYLNADFSHRGAILNEGIQVLRSLWGRPEEPFHGRFFNFEGHSFAPPPVQPGGPPIWVGGGSDAALRRAATLGDAWHGNRLPTPDLKRAVDMVNSLKGNRPVDITVRGANLVPTAEETTSAAIERWRNEVTELAGLGCTEMLVSFWQGDVERQLELIRLFAKEVKPGFSS